jgi:hypothetical protein
MGLRDIPRAAVGGYINLVRWPFDRTAKLLRGGDRRSGAEIAVDRADATARSAAGAALGDEELRRRGARRGRAAAEQDRARKLRGAASAQAEAAADKVEEQQAKAEEQRRAAAERAEAKREQAVKEKAEEEKKAKQAEQRRKKAAERAAAKRKEAAEEKAKRERLAALEANKSALDERAGAATAADEARRLEGEAAKAKAARKEGAS